MFTPEERERVLRLNVQLSRNSHEPLHAQLTRSLQNLVLRHFEKDDRFFSEEELGERLDLSVGTVRRSLNRLVEDGLLRRHRGQGSFVCRSARDDGGAGLRVIAVVNTFDSFFNGLLLRELAYLCLRGRHSLEVINPGQDERVSRTINLAAVPGARIGFAFLCLEPDFTHELATMTQHLNVPSVNIDTWIPDYPGVQICVNNRCGIELGLAHLGELGHRRIALLLSENPEHVNIRDRIEAFHAGIAARGLEGSVVEPSSLSELPDLGAELRCSTQNRYDARIGTRTAERIIATGASAVLCVSDIGACFLMKRLHMAGMRVPEDISVMGFNDEGTGLMMYPELTTIAQPYEEIATAALDHLERFDTSTRHIRVEPRLVVRSSTAAVR